MQRIALHFGIAIRDGLVKYLTALPCTRELLQTAPIARQSARAGCCAAVTGAPLQNKTALAHAVTGSGHCHFAARQREYLRARKQWGGRRQREGVRVREVWATLRCCRVP